jgi:hypothetical protein
MIETTSSSVVSLILWIPDYFSSGASIMNFFFDTFIGLKILAGIIALPPPIIGLLITELLEI